MKKYNWQLTRSHSTPRSDWHGHELGLEKLKSEKMRLELSLRIHDAL